MKVAEVFKFNQTMSDMNSPEGMWFLAHNDLPCARSTGSEHDHKVEGLDPVTPCLMTVMLQLQGVGQLPMYALATMFRLQLVMIGAMDETGGMSARTAELLF